MNSVVAKKFIWWSLRRETSGFLAAVTQAKINLSWKPIKVSMQHFHFGSWAARSSLLWRMFLDRLASAPAPSSANSQHLRKSSPKRYAPRCPGTDVHRAVWTLPSGWVPGLGAGGKDALTRNRCWNHLQEGMNASWGPPVSKALSKAFWICLYSVLATTL